MPQGLCTGDANDVPWLSCEENRLVFVSFAEIQKEYFPLQQPGIGIPFSAAQDVDGHDHTFHEPIHS